MKTQENLNLIRCNSIDLAISALKEAINGLEGSKSEPNKKTLHSAFYRISKATRLMRQAERCEFAWAALTLNQAGYELKPEDISDWCHSDYSASLAQKEKPAKKEVGAS